MNISIYAFACNLAYLCANTCTFFKITQAHQSK